MAANQTANATVTVSPASTSLNNGGYVITNPVGPTYTYTGITGAGLSVSGANYTHGSVGPIGSWSSQSYPGATIGQGGLLEFAGKEADIKINNISLNDTLNYTRKINHIGS
jgi:hypothetical protein